MREQTLSLSQVLSNMRLLSQDSLTITGVLLFARNPQAFLPAFLVKAVCYPGNEIHATTEIDIILESSQESGLVFLSRTLLAVAMNCGIDLRK
jgi:predicted HTH transcriptional regulator